MPFSLFDDILKCHCYLARIKPILPLHKPHPDFFSHQTTCPVLTAAMSMPIHLLFLKHLKNN